MRKIKFKAKRKLNGDWVYGSFIKGESEDWDYICPQDEDLSGDGLDYYSIRVISNTVCEYVEKIDAYEGDVGILSCNSHSEALGLATGLWEVKVKYNVHKAQFMFEGLGEYDHLQWSMYDRDFNDQPYTFKVTKNIHDEEEV